MGTLRITGFFLLAGCWTGIYLLLLALRNQLIPNDRKIGIANPFTQRTHEYEYSELELMELIDDLRIKPRIRLTTRDGKTRWHYLEGIHPEDYHGIITHLKAAGVPVKTQKMGPWLKKK